jgi:hypothetical protein
MGVLMLAPGAQAAQFDAGPLTYVVKTEKAPPGGDVTVGRECPSGSRLIGGGGSIAGKPSGASADRWLFGAAPTDTGDLDVDRDDAFLTDAHNATAGNLKTTSVTICLRPGDGGLSYAENTETLTTNASVFISSATCSGASTGGGVQVEGPGEDVHIRDGFRPSADEWAGGLRKDATSQSRDSAVFVVCIPSDSRKVKYPTATRTIGEDETGALRVACPSGYRPTGGGIHPVTGIGSQARLLHSRPFDSKDPGKAPDDGWKARAFNPTNAESVEFGAVCLGPKQ